MIYMLQDGWGEGDEVCEEGGDLVELLLVCATIGGIKVG